MCHAVEGEMDEDPFPPTVIDPNQPLESGIFMHFSVEFRPPRVCHSAAIGCLSHGEIAPFR